MNFIHKHFTLTALFCLSFVALKSQDLKMNQTQVIGSHNSYKIGIEKPLIIVVMVTMSLLKPQAQDDRKHIEIDFHYFKVSPGFMAGAIIIFGILTGLYASFW